MKNKILLGIFIVIGLVLTTFFWFKQDEVVVDAQMSEDIVKEDTNEELNEEEENISYSETSKVMIDIKGAVKSPGVYEVESNSRVIDVIDMAGGLNKDANTNYINLSGKVTDEMVIWIYTTSEIDKLKLEQTSSEYMITSCNCPVVDNTTCLNSNDNSNDKSNKNSNSTKEESSSIVNINSATIEELMSLSGIGEAKAKSIIEYRTQVGKFNSIEDIMNVTGIGEALYNKIKNNIKV